MDTIKELSEKLYDALAAKGTFRESLPMHLDRDKFEHLVRKEMEGILAQDGGPFDALKQTEKEASDIMDELLMCKDVCGDCTARVRAFQEAIAS